MGQNKVRDIMTTDLVTLSPNNTVRDATIRLAVENISGAPVVDENYRMVGILSGNDILELIMKYDKKMGDDLSDHMLSFYMDADVEDPELKKVAEEISNMKVELFYRFLNCGKYEDLFLDNTGEKIEKYIIDNHGGRLDGAIGSSLGSSFVGQLIQRRKVHIDHGIFGSPDLDQSGKFFAKLQSLLVVPLLTNVTGSEKKRAKTKKKLMLLIWVRTII